MRPPRMMPSVTHTMKSSKSVDRHRRRPAPRRPRADDRARIKPAEQDAGDIGERVPADRERPDLDQDRIEVGEREDKRRHGVACLGLAGCCRNGHSQCQTRTGAARHHHGADQQPLLRRSRAADERCGRRRVGRAARVRHHGAHAGRAYLRDLEVVQREEFEAVKEMARLAREENEALKARIAALEAKLGGSTSAESEPGRRQAATPPDRFRRREQTAHLARFPCLFGLARL